MRILLVKTRFLMEIKRKVFLFQLKLAKVTMFLHQEFLDMGRVSLKVSLVPTEEVEGQDMEETMVEIDIAMVQTITINNHAKLSTKNNVLINKKKNVNLFTERNKNVKQLTKMTAIMTITVLMGDIMIMMEFSQEKGLMGDTMIMVELILDTGKNV